jgi:hypothetical protein
MHHHIDPVEPAFEEVLIGLELERVRHDTRGIGEHAILGDDGITFDATRMGHNLLVVMIEHSWSAMQVGCVQRGSNRAALQCPRARPTSPKEEFGVSRSVDFGMGICLVSSGAASQINCCQNMPGDQLPECTHPTRGGLAKACSCRCVMWPAYGKLRKSANDGTTEAKSFPGLVPP